MVRESFKLHIERYLLCDRPGTRHRREKLGAYIVSDDRIVGVCVIIITIIALFMKS